MRQVWFIICGLWARLSLVGVLCVRGETKHESRFVDVCTRSSVCVRLYARVINVSAHMQVYIASITIACGRACALVCIQKASGHEEDVTICLQTCVRKVSAEYTHDAILGRRRSVEFIVGNVRVHSSRFRNLRSAGRFCVGRGHTDSFGVPPQKRVARGRDSSA